MEGYQGIVIGALITAICFISCYYLYRWLKKNGRRYARTFCNTSNEDEETGFDHIEEPIYPYQEHPTTVQNEEIPLLQNKYSEATFISTRTQPFDDFEDFESADYAPALGYFEGDKSKVTEIVKILIIGYKFTHGETPRTPSLVADVKNIKDTFGKYRCNIVSLIGLSKSELFKVLEDEIQLRKRFKMKNTDKVDVMMVFVLSHGTTGGKIFTDHIDKETGTWEYFQKQDIWRKFNEMTFLDNALNIYILEPCRGDRSEKRFDVSHQIIEDSVTSNLMSDPTVRNNVVYYASVEETKATFNEDGTWVVQAMCSQMKGLIQDTSLENFFTYVNCTVMKKAKGIFVQTSEALLLPHKHLTLKSLVGYDSSGNTTNVSTPERIHFFNWKTSNDIELDPGVAFVFFDERHEHDAEELQVCFQTLGLKTSSHHVASIDQKLKEAKDEMDKEGVMIVCVLSSLTYNDTTGFQFDRCGVAEEFKNITDLFTFENCLAMTGRPKIFIFLDSGIGQDNGVGSTKPRKVPTNCGHSHSDSICYVAKGQSICDALKRELRDPSLINGKGEGSLQKTLTLVLNSWKGDGIVPALVTTAPLLVDFPETISYQDIRFSSEDHLSAQRIDEDMHFDALSFEVAKVLQTPKKRRIFVLCAEAGMGKSRATRQLKKYLEQRNCIVINIDARSFQDDAASTIDCLPNETTAFLFDGIDEIGMDNRAKALKLVRVAAEKYSLVWITMQPHLMEVIKDHLKGYDVVWISIRSMSHFEAESYLHRLLQGLDWLKDWNELKKQIDVPLTPQLMEIVAELLRSKRTRGNMFGERLNTFSIFWHLLELRLHQIVSKGGDRGKILESLAKAVLGAESEADVNFSAMSGIINADTAILSDNFSHRSFANFFKCLALLTSGTNDKFSQLFSDSSYPQVRQFLDDALQSKFKEGPFDIANLLENQSLQNALSSSEPAIQLLSNVCKEGRFEIYSNFRPDKALVIPEQTIDRILYDACCSNEKLALDVRYKWQADMERMLKSCDKRIFAQKLARHNHYTIFEEIKHDLEPETIKNAMREAVSAGNVQMVQKMISSAALDTDHGTQLMKMAVEFGQESVLQVLLDNRISATTGDSKGWNALHHAAALENCKIIIMLLEYVSINSQTSGEKWTPIHIAAKKGNNRAAELLVQKKSDLQIRDIAGLTALHVAAYCDNFKIIETLLKEMDVDSLSNDGRTPLHVAAGTKCSKSVLFLLLNKARIEKQDNEGKNALHHAVESGSTLMVDHILVAAGSEAVNAKTKYNETPLQIATSKGFKEIVKIFEEYEANNVIEPLSLRSVSEEVFENDSSHNEPYFKQNFIKKELLNNLQHVEVIDFDNICSKVLTALGSNDFNPLEISDINIFVVSGETGTGKSRASKELATQLKTNGIGVSEALTVLPKKRDNHSVLILDDYFKWMRSDQLPMLIKDVNNVAKEFRFIWITTPFQAVEKITDQLTNGKVMWLAIQEFSEMQSTEFLRLQIDWDVDWEEIWQSIQTKFRIVRTPLVLKMIANLLQSAEASQTLSKVTNTFQFYWQLIDFDQKTSQTMPVQGLYDQIEGSVRYLLQDIDFSQYRSSEASSNSTHSEFLTCLGLFAPADTMPNFKVGDRIMILSKPEFRNVHRFLNEALQIHFMDESNCLGYENLFSNQEVLNMLQTEDTFFLLLKNACKGGFSYLYFEIVRNRFPITDDQIEELLAICLLQLNEPRQTDELEKIAFDLLDKGANMTTGLDPLLLRSLALSDKWQLLEQAPFFAVATKVLSQSIIEAARIGNTKTVLVMLSKGSETDVAEVVRMTTLNDAIHQKDEKRVIEILLDGGCDGNAILNKGETPLHLASKAGNLGAVEALLFKGATFDAVAIDGWQPLHSAATWGTGTEILKLLLDKGAQVDARSQDLRTPLMLVSDEEKARVLLDSGADISAVDGEGSSALHFAVSSGCLKVVELLVNRGANINAVTLKGVTPLNLAMQKREHEVCQFLRERGATILYSEVTKI